jgi:hypothetical protein
MLLSIITFGLVAVAMFGMYYLTGTHIETRSHVSRYWTETSIGVFLGIVVKCINGKQMFCDIEHFNYKQTSEREMILDELFALPLAAF